MPTFNYFCKSCDGIWEEWQTVRTVPVCPKCNILMTQIIEPPNVHFHHTDKEVRIPSPPKSVYIRRDK